MSISSDTPESFMAGRRELCILFLVTLLGLLLRVGYLDRESLWTDEVHSVYLATVPVQETLDEFKLTDHPPLYFLLLRVWMWISNSDVWVRLLSVLIGTLTVPAVYLLGKQIRRNFFGLLCALFFSLSTLHIRYSREVRGYVLLCLLAILTLYFYLRLCEHPHHRLLILGYIVCSVALVATHNVGWIYCVIAAIALLRVWRKNNCRDSIWLWFGIHGFILLLALPVLVLAALQAYSKTNTGFWIKPPTFAEMGAVISSLVATELPVPNSIILPLTGYSSHFAQSRFFAAIPLGIAIAGGFWNIFNNNDFHHARSMVLLLGSYFCVLVVLSWLFIPVFADRTAIPLTVGTALLFASFMVFLRESASRKIGSAVFVILLFILFFGAVLELKNSRKEGWRQTAETVAKEWKPGDQIVYWPYLPGLALDYYLDKNKLSSISYGIPASYCEALHDSPQSDAQIRIQTALDSLKSGHTLFYVRFTSPPEVSPLETVLAEKGRTPSSVAYYNGIKLIIYKP